MSTSTVLSTARVPRHPRGDEGAVGRVAAAATAGLLAAFVAVGIGHLVAALVRPAASPLIAIGSTFIDLTPEWLKSFAIATFGESDKAALLVGIAVTLGVGSLVVGVVALRSLRVSLLLVAMLGVVGGLAAALRPPADVVATIPSIAGALAGAGVLAALVRRIDPPAPEPAAAGGPGAEHGSRRGFLVAAGGAGTLALVAGAAGVAIAGRRAAAARAANATVPIPVDAAAPLPPGADLRLADLSPFHTPNDLFYRVDTALSVPAIDPETWRLRIHGMVDREITLSLPELLDLPIVERDLTLACVSNQVGGGFVGTARWTGVPLAAVLGEAGVRAGADQIVSRSIDGMTIGTPTAVALDGRDSLLAVAMNGVPLPPEHGAPVRMLVPGLYGYVSATKWLVDIELTTFAAYDAYWVQRGWAEQAPIKTMTRIDTPRPLARLAPGEIAVAGVAWAPHRGIRQVEVQVDDEPWQVATLAAVPSADTWRQWVWRWRAEPGRHRIRARSTDATGELQTESRAEPFPSGATGWHSVVVTVE